MQRLTSKSSRLAIRNRGQLCPTTCTTGIDLRRAFYLTFLTHGTVRAFLLHRLKMKATESLEEDALG